MPIRSPAVHAQLSRPGHLDRVSKQRRNAFRWLALGLSLLPFVALELGLRLTEEPLREAIDDDPLVNLDGLQPLFVLDDDSDAESRWVIPKTRMNFFRPASFLDNKPATAKRIFVLGGSTVQGRPYATETAFSTWLELWLKAASPETTFEVVNCGGVSYASYRVSKILDEVLTHQPDVIVLYTGHNEFLESRSYADVIEMPETQRWVSRLASKLSTVRAVRRMLSPRETGQGPAQRTKFSTEVDTRLDHAGGLAEYHRDDVWRADVEKHFSRTLRQMAIACQDANVPLVVCVPACDLVNTPPFKIEPSLTLAGDLRNEFHLAWRIATDVESTADRTQRVAACENCLRLDPDHAGASYLLGARAYEDGKSSRAREYLQRAADNDVCPLRATSSIVNSTHAVIDELGLSSVDVPSLLDQRNARGLPIPDAIADPERFVDHVHPTIGGHQLIAEAIAHELEKLDWPKADASAVQRYRESSQTHLSSLSEAYYGRGKQRLAGLRNWAAGRAADVGISWLVESDETTVGGNEAPDRP